MPHIIVKLWSGTSEAQKHRLANELTKTAMSVTGYGEESFSVAIEDIEPEDWGDNVYLPDIVEQKEIIYKQPGYKL